MNGLGCLVKNNQQTDTQRNHKTEHNIKEQQEQEL